MEKFTISLQFSGKLISNSTSGNLAKENHKDVHKYLTINIYTPGPYVIVKIWKGTNVQKDWFKMKYYTTVNKHCTQLYMERCSW